MSLGKNELPFIESLSQRELSVSSLRLVFKDQHKAGLNCEGRRKD